MAASSCLVLRCFLEVLCILSVFATCGETSDVVIGFEVTEFTVPEDMGQVELCLVVISPTQDVDFVDTYTIGAETVEGTAGSDDYEEIVGEGSPQLYFTNENRRHCFRVAITNDELLEESEIFSVEARENPPVFIDMTGVSLLTSQSSVRITITDEDEATIGFSPSIYRKPEGSMVTMNLGMTSGQLGRNISIRFTLDHNINALDVANIKYHTGFTEVRFTPTHSSLSVISFSVYDDDLVEIDEVYTAQLLNIRNSISGLTVTPTSATVTIPNHDIAIIGFTQPEYIVPDSVNMTSVTVVIRPPKQFGRPKKAMVTLTTASGITLSDTDSMSHTTDLTFNAVKDSIIVSLVITDDAFVTPIRFLLTLSTETSDVILDPAETNITIVKKNDICAADTTTLVTTNTTYSWPVTVIGMTEYQPCPSQPGASPSASVSRNCTCGGVWRDVDYSQCSIWVASVLDIKTSRLEELQPEVVSEVIVLTDTVLTEEAITDREVARQYLNIIDNIQQVSVSVIQTSEEQSDTSLSLRVIESLGKFQNEVEISPNATNGSQVFARETYAIQVRDIDTESFSGETFSVDLGSFEEALSRNTSIPEEAIQTTLTNVTASITIPPNLITNHQRGARQSLETQRLSYSVFLTDILFQSPNQTAQNLSIGTVIIAVRLQNFLMNETVLPLVNTTFLFSEIAKAAKSSHCVHWKPSDKFGEWSSDGCREVESEGKEKICECSIDRPSTHFAVLFDLNPSPLPSAVGTALEVITYVGLTVSVLSLIILIATYLFSKVLRSSHHGHILLNICVSLLGLYIFFLIAAHVTGVPGLCGLVSALLHYFILVFFGWIATQAVYLYIKLVKVIGTEKYERGFTWKAGIIVWATPALIVIISQAGYKYYTSKYYCRPTQWPFFFGLILPVAVIIIFNWVMFFVIIVSIFKHTRASAIAETKEKIRRFKQKLITAMVLAVMFGLGWVLGFLATSTAVQGITIAFQTIFALFVGSQGLLLLIFHGCCSEKARESWKRFFLAVSPKAFSPTGNVFTAVFSSSLAVLKKSNPPETISTSNPSCLQAASEIESGMSARDSIVGNEVDNKHGYKTNNGDPPTHLNENNKIFNEEQPDLHSLEKNEVHPVILEK